MLEGGFLAGVADSGAGGDSSAPDSLRRCVGAHVGALRAAPLVDAFCSPSAHGVVGAALAIGAAVSAALATKARNERLAASRVDQSSASVARRQRAVWRAQLSTSVANAAADEQWRAARDAVASAVLQEVGAAAPCIAALPLPFSTATMLKTSLALGLAAQPSAPAAAGSARLGVEGASAVAMVSAWRAQEPPSKRKKKQNATQSSSHAKARDSMVSASLEVKASYR